MGGEDDRAVIGAIGQFLDEDRTLRLQVIDDEFVVHDLVPDIDRRAPFAQRHLDDLDGAVHAGAEAAWGREVEGEGRFGHGIGLIGWCMIGKCPVE